MSLVKAVLAALGALLLLVPHAATAADDDPVLAVINGRELRESYVYQQIESLPLGEQVDIRQRIDHFVESLVREEALFQSVLVNDFADEPELRETIKNQVVEALIERHVRAKVEVTEADVRAYYDNNKPTIRGEYVAAKLIVVDDFEHCESLLDSITSDEAFATASSKFSIDPEVKERAGDIGLFMPHVGPWGFEEALFEMQPGEQKIFDIDNRCHLVRITERVTPPLPPIEKVAANIERLVKRDQEVRLLRELFERSEAQVRIERGEE